MKDKKFVYCLQRSDGKVKFIKNKPLKYHDAYCYDMDFIYFIWYKEFVYD